MCIALITDAIISRDRRTDVIIFVDMKVALPTGKL